MLDLTDAEIKVAKRWLTGKFIELSKTNPDTYKFCVKQGWIIPEKEVQGE